MTIRWNPLRDILNIQDRMNRIFQDDLQGSDLTHSGEWVPPVDIYETESDIVILAELPGISEDNIDVQVSDGVLTIKGVKHSPIEQGPDVYYRLERTTGRFARSFALPVGVDAATVKASIKDGVLKITLSKNKTVMPKSIKVVKSEDAD